MHDAIYRLRMCSVTEKVYRGLDDLDYSVVFRPLQWKVMPVDIPSEYCAPDSDFNSKYLHFSELKTILRLSVD